MTNETLLSIKFPFTYKSPDNHPDDGIAAKSILEKVLGVSLTMEQHDFEENDDWYSWTFDIAKKPYYTIMHFDTDTKKWNIEFGDYDLKVVKEELKEYKYNADRGKTKYFKIVRTDVQQSEINAKLNEMNQIPAIIDIGHKIIVHKTIGKVVGLANNKVYINYENKYSNYNNESIEQNRFKWNSFEQAWVYQVC